MNCLQRFLVSCFAKVKYRTVCVVERDAVVFGHCVFEGRNKISPGAYVKNCMLGYGSYIGMNSTFSNARFGRFCSIGDNVKLITATHPVEKFASTHPAFYSTETLSSFVSEKKYDDIVKDEKGFSLSVGSDVWIGSHTLIRAGIHIGNGAVIAMGAVVTKDVPDYAIVGGVPARIIRYRFTDDIRRRLIATCWWERDIEWISRNPSLFVDVNLLLDHLKDS